MSEAKGKVVHLEGSELDNVRNLMRVVHDHLDKVGEIVLGKFDEAADKPLTKFKIETLLATRRTIMYDGTGTCYVYEDPPGVCRPCGGEPDE